MHSGNLIIYIDWNAVVKVIHYLPLIMNVCTLAVKKNGILLLSTYIN